jgi:signal transduction histidine kinase
VRFANHAGRDHIVIGNQDRLVQIFVNLLRNAVIAVKSSGTIQVQSCELAANGKRWVSVTVDDNGPGIPPDVLPHIFEAFVTSRLDARGTGLGLTVAEGLVKQHGGTIEASNHPGGGARIEVQLPAAPGGAGDTPGKEGRHED